MLWRSRKKLQESLRRKTDRISSLHDRRSYDVVLVQCQGPGNTHTRDIGVSIRHIEHSSYLNRRYHLFIITTLISLSYTYLVIFLYNNYIQRYNIYYIFTYHLTTLNAIIHFLSFSFLRSFILYHHRFIIKSFVKSKNSSRARVYVCVGVDVCIESYFRYTHTWHIHVADRFA